MFEPTTLKPVTLTGDVLLICQLTDFHVCPIGRASNRMAETNMLTERALRAVAAFVPRPDVLLITGDLAENGLATEYSLIADMLRRHIKIPVYVIPGNHDRRNSFRAGLSHFPGVTTDPEFVHYVIDDFPVRIVMLDTVVPDAAHGELCASRLTYLDRILEAAPHRPTLIGMHHPPFACGIAGLDAINLRNAKAFASVIERHPQVRRIISGHNHRPIVAQVAHAVASICPSVAHQPILNLAPASHAPEVVHQAYFVMEPAAYQIHRWTSADGFVSHTGYVESYPGPFPYLDEIDPTDEKNTIKMPISIAHPI